jgi:hypothetical protein
MSGDKFIILLFMGATIRAIYYTTVYWLIYKEIRNNERNL